MWKRNGLRGRDLAGVCPTDDKSLTTCKPLPPHCLPCSLQRAHFTDEETEARRSKVPQRPKTSRWGPKTHRLQLQIPQGGRQPGCGLGTGTGAGRTGSLMERVVPPHPSAHQNRLSPGGTRCAVTSGPRGGGKQAQDARSEETPHHGRQGSAPSGGAAKQDIWSPGSVAGCGVGTGEAPGKPRPHPPKCGLPSRLGWVQSHPPVRPTNAHRGSGSGPTWGDPPS